MQETREGQKAARLLLDILCSSCSIVAPHCGVLSSPQNVWLSSRLLLLVTVAIGARLAHLTVISFIWHQLTQQDFLLALWNNTEARDWKQYDPTGQHTWNYAKGVNCKAMDLEKTPTRPLMTRTMKWALKLGSDHWRMVLFEALVYIVASKLISLL